MIRLRAIRPKRDATWDSVRACAEFFGAKKAVIDLAALDKGVMRYKAIHPK